MQYSVTHAPCYSIVKVVPQKHITAATIDFTTSFHYLSQNPMMFSSIFTSSSTKPVCVDRGVCRTTCGDDNVQVEVSFDVFDKFHSIAVTENASLQSVVSVPSDQPLNRRRTNEKALKHVSASPNYATRLADAIRPSSPLHERHNNAPTSINQKSRGRGRGRESNSCPPPLNRGQQNVSLGTSFDTNNRQTKVQSRDSSCPPTGSRSNATSNDIHRYPTKSLQSEKTTTTLQSSNQKKTKDLVSKSVIKNKQRSLFGSIRKTTTKIVPAP
jgi:hypothetical protein